MIMKVVTELTMKLDDPSCLIKALEPDNMPNMQCSVTDGAGHFRIGSEKLSSMIAVLDDLLMNIKIAEDIMEAVEDDGEGDA